MQLTIILSGKRIQKKKFQKVPDFSVEDSARSKGHFFIAGVDEAGRGSWAGPVVAGAVILEADNLIPPLRSELDDSKKLTVRKRQKLFEMLPTCALIGVGIADVNEIDRDGNPVLDGDGKQHVTQGVKSSLKEAVNSQQGSLLIQTDWMYIRKIDKAVEIPLHIQIYRDAIRVQGDAMKAAIDAALTTEEMVALFVKYTANEDGSQTKSGILYDWPELEE